MTAPMRHIREHVLELSQAKLAAIVGVSQTEVSRWELGKSEPNRAQMAAIMAHARQKGRHIEEKWFFEIPTAVGLVPSETLPQPNPTTEDIGR